MSNIVIYSTKPMPEFENILAEIEDAEARTVDISKMKEYAVINPSLIIVTDIELAKSVLQDIMVCDERILADEVKQVYVVKLDSYAVQIRFRCWTTFENYWPVYNDLSEKILIAFRKNKIYIPSSTDIAVKQK